LLAPPDPSGDAGRPVGCARSTIGNAVYGILCEREVPHDVSCRTLNVENPPRAAGELDMLGRDQRGALARDVGVSASAFGRIAAAGERGGELNG